MARKTGNCPACGGTVEFKSATSLVTVCPYCHSVVARQDRQLSDQGKIAEIAESRSPLQLGLRGVWQGKAFRLIGRVQYRHSAGGVWDEWYVQFPGGKWGWLSEAQGRFGILRARSIKDPSQLPSYESLQAGESLTLDGSEKLLVTEVGRSAVAAAEGELPFSPILQAEHRFADLEGSHGKLATIEYGDQGPQAYLGETATLLDLGLMDAALKEESTRQVGALQLNCPRCGGPLALVQPDEAQRVTCPNCNALLNVEGQKLEYLTTLKPPNPRLKLPLGSKGRLRGVDYQVIGYLRRSVTYDKTYYWQEYLLYEPRHGYAWLIDSDNHWSLGKAVPSGSVERSYPTATYNTRSFRLFQKAKATVRQVWGEFYWKVSVGEAVQMYDYIAPPYSLSLELTSSSEAGETGIPSEINATVSEYLRHEEVEQAFGVSGLPRAWGVAPNQPNPVNNVVFLHWILFVAGIFAIHALFPAMTGRSVDTALSLWAAGLMSVLPLGTLLYSHGFERSRWQDSEFNPYDTGGDDDDDD